MCVGGYQFDAGQRCHTLTALEPWRRPSSLLFPSRLQGSVCMCQPWRETRPYSQAYHDYTYPGHIGRPTLQGLSQHNDPARVPTLAQIQVHSTACHDCFVNHGRHCCLSSVSLTASQQLMPLARAFNTESNYQVKRGVIIRGESTALQTYSS